jgi:hypothetical protein
MGAGVFGTARARGIRFAIFAEHGCQISEEAQSLPAVSSIERGDQLMSSVRRLVVAVAAASTCALAGYVLGPEDISAQSTFPDPNANCPPAECGQVSPFIPMQSVEAVHMGLVWKKNSQKPKILYHSRFPEYSVNDMADPALVDLAIERGALTTPGLQFNSSLRDVLHGFDPFLGLGMARSADDSFQRLT